MKKLSKVLLLATCLLTASVSVWGQASTQGTEFWVSSTIVCSPDKNASNRKPTPYIAVSAEKACTVHITGGVGNAINITQQVAAGSWSEFGNGTTSQLDPSVGPVKVPMDASKWYPTTMTDADKVRTLAGQKNMYGLHITATENISVYVILSTLNSMDASNILPLTALGSEYYTQDYWPIVKSDWDNTVTMTTILATEDNTEVDITPNGNTYDGKQSGQPYTVSLIKGQTYYLMSQADKQLTGTHIQARNGKKIAIFNGVPLTNLPTDIAARDGLFEQSMPIEYWGTQFIVARSLEKNGNLIGITATTNGTEIKVDGYTQDYINEGETYYIMLQASNDPNGNKPGTIPIDLVITQDAVFIETSCPAAVYSYDTGNSYKGKNGDEIVNSQGDPSSVWVAPIQQKIGKITFGTCYTTKTEEHFLNVVTETATCQNTKLTALFGNNTLDKTSVLTWTPVAGNPKYSYARAKIGTASTKEYSVFRLENPKGFIATVYGNGNDESYAYSAGSAAVEQGVNVGDVTFTQNIRSDHKFCLNEDLTFNAVAGTDELSQVNWDFGDGTSLMDGGVEATHKYSSPGWYDVRADLYGAPVCSGVTGQYLGTVQFTLRVWKPQEIWKDPDPKPECLSLEDQANDPEGCANKVKYGELVRTPVDPNDCASDTIYQYTYYALETKEEYDLQAEDQIEINGTVYTASDDIEWVEENSFGCPHNITCHLTIITCLDLTIDNNPDEQIACYGEDLSIAYNKIKGDINNNGEPGGDKLQFICGNLTKEVALSDGNTNTNGTITIPTSSLQPGVYQAKLVAEDFYCNTTYEYPLNFTVYYPQDIFKLKFGNTLAVYKPGYGGNKGWTFSAYQWYYNGEPIQGATSSVYHNPSNNTFVEDGLTGEYAVELTRKDTGERLMSCPLTISADANAPAMQDDEPEPAQKVLNGQHIFILRDGQTYNIYGQKVL